MSITVRPIQPNDKSQWVQLWSGKDSYLEFYKSLDKVTPKITDTTFSRFLDADEPVYCAVAVDAHGDLVGFATYLTHRNTWTIENSLYLNDLFVKPTCRLGGIGRKLFEYVYAEADKMKVGKTYWNTQFENHRAQMLYVKVGKKSGFLSYVRG